MADENITFEVWTLPSTGAFTKRNEITRKVASYNLTVKWSEINDGQIMLDGTTINLDDLLYIDENNHANDVGSVIRVLRNGVPKLHYVVTDLRQPYNSDTPLIPATLQGMEWFLDRAQIKRFDHPNIPSYDPDWEYGAATIIKGISGEETNELQEIWVNASAGTFKITDGTDTTQAIAWDASAGVIANRLETDITGITDVSVTGTGALKTPYEIEFRNPTSYTQLTIGANNTNGVISVSTTREGGSISERPWHKSFNPVTGVEHGNYQVFQIGTAVVNTAAGSTYSLEIDLDSVRWPADYGGAQQIVSVEPGSLYRASIPVNPGTTDKRVRLVIRDLQENLIAVSDDVTLPANTWTLVETQGPQFYTPSNVTEVIFRVGILETTNIGKVYVDVENALFAPGKPADTVGFILRDLLVPINTRGVLTWLTPTWTDAGDSTGASWNQNISISVTRGQSILQLLDFLKKSYGYTWDLEWNTSLSRWDWHMYNPNGGGTITTATITGRGGVVESAPVVRRIPDFNSAEAEGDKGQWGENNNAASQTAIGMLEKYFGNRQGNEATQLVTVAGQRINDALTKTAGRRVKLADPNNLPFDAYRDGDYITLNLEPVEPKAVLRVAGITMTMDAAGTIPTYDVHLTSLVFDPETALVNTVRGLVRSFDELERAAPAPTASLDPALFGGSTTGGGPPYLLVAAYNARQKVKDIADYQCDGVDDQEEINAALQAAKLNPNYTTVVLLSDGDFVINEWTVDHTWKAHYGVQVPQGVTLRGMGGMYPTFVQFDLTRHYDPNPPYELLNFPTNYPVALIHKVGADGGVSDMYTVCYDPVPVDDAYADAARMCNMYAGGAWETQIERVYFDVQGWGGVGLYIKYGAQSHDVTVRDCHFDGTSVGIYNDYALGARMRGILIAGGNNTRIESCNFTNFDHAIDVFSDAQDGQARGHEIGHIEGCYFWYPNQYAIKFHNAQTWQTKILNNRFIQAGHGWEVSRPDIGCCIDVSYGWGGFIIANNTMHQSQQTAIYLRQNTVTNAAITDAFITGNTLYEMEMHGIVLDHADRCVVSNNLIKVMWGNFNTHDYGIWVKSGADRNFIHHNHIEPWQPYNRSGQLHNGIRLESGVTNNIVVGNYLTPITATDSYPYPIVNFGTGTVLNYPNHSTFGDNFTYFGFGTGGSGDGGGPLPTQAIPQLPITLPTPTLVGNINLTITPTPVAAAVGIPTPTAQQDPVYDAIVYPNRTLVTVTLPASRVVRSDTRSVNTVSVTVTLPAATAVVT